MCKVESRGLGVSRCLSACCLLFLGSPPVGFDCLQSMYDMFATNQMYSEYCTSVTRGMYKFDKYSSGNDLTSSSLNSKHLQV